MTHTVNYTSDSYLYMTNEKAVVENIPTFVFMAVTIALGMTGNLLTFVFYGFVEKKTVTTFLITALALNDLCSSVAMFDHIILVRFLIRYKSKLGCELTYFVNHFFVLNSVMFLNPIGIERCLRVCTQNPKYQVSKTKAAGMIASLSIYSFSVALRHFFIVGIEETKITMSDNTVITGFLCSLIHQQKYSAIINTFHLLDIFGFVLTNILLAIVYGIMAKKIGLVRKRIGAYPFNASTDVQSLRVSVTADGSGSTSNRDTSKRIEFRSQNPTWVSHRRENRERKINIMLGTITLSSLLSFVPYFYVVVVVKPQETPGAFTFDPLVQTGWRSFMLNSSINPYIIGLFNSQFRNFVSDIFRCRSDSSNKCTCKFRF